MSQSDSPSPRRKFPLWAWFALANVLVIAAAGGAWYLFYGKSLRAPDPKIRTVLPAPPRPDEPKRPKFSIGGIIAKVDPGVVLITLKNAKKDKIGLGSGFLIDSSGLVATNYHVISKATAATATFADGTAVDVKGCRAWDADGDLAILELASIPKKAEPLPLCQNTERTIGSDVIAVGHPQGFRFTSTTGIISAVHPTSELPGQYRELIEAPEDNVWIQTSAAINGGNSGGPLLNYDGEVIAINTWIARGQNLGFATDIRHLLKLYKEKLAPQALRLADLTAPEQQIDELQEDFVNQYKYLLLAASKSWTRSGAKQMIESKHPALIYLPKAMELADKYRKLPAGYRAIEAACTIAACDDCPKACEALFKPVGKRVLDDYLEKPGVIRLLFKLEESPLDEVRGFLRQVAEKAKTPRTRALATLALALLLERHAGEKKEQSAEAIKLLEEVRSKYADVQWQDGRLGELLEPLVFSLKYLQVGCTPPDIAGKDVFGDDLKLSDFRGKVVVLDFWVDWCPYCREMYPIERQLTKSAKDKPLVVLGVNCDEPARLRQLIGDGTVTWRNVSDGSHGSIQQTWQVASYPTVYVLDHEGVIRYRDVRGMDLNTAVETLLKKIPKPGSAVAAKAAENPAKPAAEKHGPAETPAATQVAGQAQASVKPAETAAQGEPRLWTRKDGRTARLRLLKSDGKTATFLTASGKPYVMALNDLSDADQAWIRAHSK